MQSGQFFTAGSPPVQLASLFLDRSARPRHIHTCPKSLHPQQQTTSSPQPSVTPTPRSTKPFTAVTLANVVSVVFAAPLAAGIMTINAAGLKGWQWLFVIEGIPSVLLGLAMLVSVDWDRIFMHFFEKITKTLSMLCTTWFVLEE